MLIHTVGYGGRPPHEFVALLQERGISLVVDVRARPDRANMGAYSLARDEERGIRGLLGRAGIRYLSLVELGNPFLEFEDWKERYRRLLAGSGELLTERLRALPESFCLLCAEKRSEECHRRLLADYLAERGYQVEHIE